MGSPSASLTSRSAPARYAQEGSCPSFYEAGIGYSTVSLQINFVRPVQDGIKELLAEGRVVYLGKRQATAEGAIRDSEGRLYAHGMTTCLILR